MMFGPKVLLFAGATPLTWLRNSRAWLRPKRPTAALTFRVPFAAVRAVVWRLPMVSVVVVPALVRMVGVMVLAPPVRMTLLSVAALSDEPPGVSVRPPPCSVIGVLAVMRSGLDTPLGLRPD